MRRTLYRLGSFLGWVTAIGGGLGKLLRRVGRVGAWRWFGGLFK